MNEEIERKDLVEYTIENVCITKNKMKAIFFSIEE